MAHEAERFVVAPPAFMVGLKIMRLRAALAFARAMGVPVRVRDEFWLGASRLEPTVGSDGNAMSPPLEGGR